MTETPPRPPEAVFEAARRLARAAALKWVREQQKAAQERPLPDRGSDCG